jgi:hypothetical protein
MRNRAKSREAKQAGGGLRLTAQQLLDLPRLRGHPEKHESALGVGDGEERQRQAEIVFG